MSNIRVAKRYAKGFFLFTEEDGKTKEVYKEMQELDDLISQSKDLRNFLTTPILDFKTKQKIADQLFASYSKVTQTFIQVVIEHGREANLQEMTIEYINLSDQKNHVKKALLITAAQLDKKYVDEIINESGLIKKGDHLELTQQVDPSLIGGYIFQVGDQQIDASVRNRFNQLKQNFDENYYVPKY